MGVLTLGSVQPIMAQDAAPAQTEQTTEAAVVEEGGGLHKELKLSSSKVMLVLCLW